MPACCAHSARSMYSWIAEAPGTVSVTNGRFRSGMFSLKFVNDHSSPSGDRNLRLDKVVFYNR